MAGFTRPISALPGHLAPVYPKASKVITDIEKKGQAMKIRLTLILLSLLFLPVFAQPMPTQGLDGVIVHVGFAHDRGSVLDAVEYKGQKYEWDEAADAVIPKIGWKDKSKREDIAWAWVTQVCMVGNTLLEEAPEDFVDAKVEFETPKVHLFDDGSVEVILWYRDPTGMVPQISYSKRSFKFTPQGKLTISALDDVAFPIK
jgi:hypothetical protein